LHAEILGNPVIPSSDDIIDAYRIPILLLRASKAGIPTMPYLVSSSVKQIIYEVGFPMVIFPVNPFSFEGYKIAKNRSALYRAIKSLSMNYKFAVCAQPFRGEILSFNSYFGKCDLEKNLQDISEKVYGVFKVPICKLHVQRIADKIYLSGLQPLKKDEINQLGLKIIAEEIFQISRNGECTIG